MDVPMQLSRIVISERNDQQMIFLSEVDGDRTLPILIGIGEALAIDRRVNGHELPRPMTHELLTNVIKQMGGMLTRVVVNDLQAHTFIATIYIEVDGRSVPIDARPSDAIALAIGNQVPIFVSAKLVDQAGVRVDDLDDHRPSKKVDPVAL